MGAAGKEFGKGAEHVIAKAVESAGVREAERVTEKEGVQAGEKAAEKAAGREIGGHTVSDLEKAAAAEDRGGMTRAGRAAQKHGDRPGSAFPKAPSTAAGRNEAGQKMVHDILHDPGSRTVVRDRVIEVWDSSGRGARFTRDGKFMGFLEPTT